LGKAYTYLRLRSDLVDCGQMGLCQGSPDDSEKTSQEKFEKVVSKEQDKKLKEDQALDQEVNKLLLLGAGESGKSTLFKQMNNIYGTGFPEEDRKNYEYIIYNNIISSMQALVAASQTSVGAPVACQESLLFVKNMGQDGAIDSKNVFHFKALWRDSGIQQTFDNRAKFQVNDSAKYFFDRLDDISTPGYIPTEQDVLRARVRTLGIVESAFEIDGNKFKMIDVGGQRNERKKWIHCFENVTSVLFVGVLSEYDQVLYEDATVNRMVETLLLFEEICNSPWFKETAVILFLNKRDMFEEKIRKVPLTVCSIFANWNGPQTYEAGVEAIEEVFQQKNHNREKVIYSHVTCATDTTQVAAVFHAVKDIIIRRALGDAGLV